MKKYQILLAGFLCCMPLNIAAMMRLQPGMENHNVIVRVVQKEDQVNNLFKKGLRPLPTYVLGSCVVSQWTEASYDSDVNMEDASSFCSSSEEDEEIEDPASEDGNSQRFILLPQDNTTQFAGKVGRAELQKEISDSSCSRRPRQPRQLFP